MTFNSNTTTHIKVLSENEFDSLEDSWEELINQSSADPLFMGWNWQNTWWHIFGRNNNYQLLLIAIYDKNNILIGLAPLYRHVVTIKKLKFVRIEFIGNTWRNQNNIRSEYISFIVNDKYKVILESALLEYIYSIKGWDEFVLTNHLSDNDSTSNIRKYIKSKNSYLRSHEKGSTYFVDTSNDFNNYLINLGPKTRSKIFNQRKKLLERGEVSLIKASEYEVEKYFDLMNKMHYSRWNKKLFDGERLDFHIKIAKTAYRNGQLQLEALCVSGKKVSILYDFLVNNIKYGYQLAFDQYFDKKISINQLHFGYSLESTFNSTICIYDFLRGMGKSQTSYKDSIAKPYKNTETSQIIRNPILKIIYKIYDIL